MTDPFRHDDAAYVLGALDDTERDAFEAHLVTCPDCRSRVAEARASTALLAGVDPDVLADAGPAPDTLLPALLRAAARERARRRRLTGALTGLAAACVAALVVTFWPAGGANPPAPAAFASVRPNPVSATARLVSKSWGTEIELHCTYASGVDAYVPYRLQVTDRGAHTYDAGSWTLTPGRATDFTGGTAVPRADIAKLTITLADGTPILQLTR